MTSETPIRLLSIEDEPLIAQRLKRFAASILGEQLVSFSLCESIGEGLEFLEARPVDLLLLDPNLQGEDGFKVLERVTSYAAQTVIVSAHSERAATAFDYGVIDFVSKPFDEPRLALAFERFQTRRPKQATAAKYLSFRTGRRVEVVPLEDVALLRGADKYSEVLLASGDIKLHDKALGKLEPHLPETFLRIHKSYIVRLDQVDRYESFPGNKMELVLHNGERAPVSRSKMADVRALFQ
ncbi:LytTR family DNA-binding domain-containing protein [Maricaulis sp.]|uniref:LytR/AlgR family response regulator transcription factor n=1 Tax=Maricaulis sp. TaxID=1486257 RepID=UPI001B26E282|nr:LytTR family DNA-binding domain-containing protein [Maricaulis sp.]MBO6797669.1 response regulator transcription factor [Maricaulis sp.]